MSAGDFANTGPNSSWLVHYLSFISPARYTCELAMRRELTGEPKFWQTVILDYLGYTWGYKRCYLFMVGYIIFVFLLGWII